MPARCATGIALLLACLRLLGCAAAGEIPVYPDAPRAVRGDFSLLIVGDTQSPIWFETLRLQTDENERATHKIFRAMSKDSACAAVFHLGDLTALGSYESYWETFDDESAPLRAAAIPLYPAAGNHEYMPFGDAGRDNLIRRFPALLVPWYKRQIGGAAVLVLNSNFDYLTPEERDRQQRWYERALDRLDADTTVTVVIVICHHPPYTNSTIVGPDEDVRRSFVPPFLRSTKALLFLSGHAHAFEHFCINGKNFIVSGGGGGLLHPLLRDREARWPDLFMHDEERSFFHYLRLVPRAGGPAGPRLSVDVLRLLPSPRGFENAYHCDLP